MADRPRPAQAVVYEPDTGRLPRLGPYLRDLWHRRDFLVELARSDLKAQHYATAFGQAWNILSPLLMAGVYLLLLTVIARGRRSNLEIAALISGVFFFQYTRESVSIGASAVLRGQRLVLNAVFPRAILPLSSVISSSLLFLPMVAVYLLIHLILGLPIGLSLFYLALIIVLLSVFNIGVTLFYSALAVEIRDAATFLPHVLRYWFYMTPVLYLVQDIPPSMAPVLRFNPLYPTFAALQRVIDGGRPTVLHIVGAAVWAVVALAVGGWFFLGRERHFGTRI